LNLNSERLDMEMEIGHGDEDLVVFCAQCQLGSEDIAEIEAEMEVDTVI